MNRSIKQRDTSRVKQVVEAGPTPFYAFYAPLLRRRGCKKAVDGWRQKEDPCHWQCVSPVRERGGKGTDNQGGHVARTPVRMLENVLAD